MEHCLLGVKHHSLTKGHLRLSKDVGIDYLYIFLYNNGKHPFVLDILQG